MDIFKKLIDEGKITEDELARAIKALAGEQEEKTWEEKHEELIEKNREQARETAKRVEQADKNFVFNEKGKFLATLVNKYNERTYSLAEISRMPGYQIDELYEMYSNVPDLNTRPLTEEEELKYEKLNKLLTADGTEKSANASFDDEVVMKDTTASETEEKTEENKETEEKEEQKEVVDPIEQVAKDTTKEEPKKVKFITNIKNWTKKHASIAGGLAAVVVIAGVVFGVPAALGTTAGELAALYITSKATLGKHK